MENSQDIEYRVVIGLDRSLLVTAVNSWLADGWQLHGGVSVTCDAGALRFAQAMTRELNQKDSHDGR